MERSARHTRLAGGAVPRPRKANRGVPAPPGDAVQQELPRVLVLEFGAALFTAPKGRERPERVWADDAGAERGAPHRGEPSRGRAQARRPGAAWTRVGHTSPGRGGQTQRPRSTRLRCRAASGGGRGAGTESRAGGVGGAGAGRPGRGRGGAGVLANARGPSGVGRARPLIGGGGLTTSRVR